MSNHTPGPWAVSCAGLERRNIRRVRLGKQAEIEWGNAASDSLLIAAAPELLEALDALQANPNDPLCHRMAIDAMKKARGEE